MEFLPALAPVVCELAGGDLDEGVADGRRQVGQRGQLTGGAVDGVLDRLAAVEPALFDAGRGELQQRGEDHLGLRARDAQSPAASRGLATQDAAELGEHAFLGAQVLLGQGVVRAARVALAAQPKGAAG